MVESIVAAGHELGHHGYSHVPYHRMTDDEQKRDIERAFASLERVTGLRPEGFRAPWWELTNSTPGILADFGVTWDSSMMDDDRPYLLDTGRGILAELPVHWMLDDWEQYAFLPEPHIGAVIESPAKVLDLWGGELEALADEGGLMMHTSHPFLSGRAVAGRDARAGRRARPRAGRRLDRAGRRDRRAHPDGDRRGRRAAGAHRSDRGGRLWRLRQRHPARSSGRRPGSSARRAGGTSSSTT